MSPLLFLFFGIIQTPDMVTVQPASGYAPPAIVIAATASNDVQVCASASRMVSCKSVGEFRAWVQQRPVLMKK